VRLNNKEGLIMLSKNNYNEKLRKMKLQARQDHFSIRKLTIGVASVLLGYAFFGAGSQTVKADTESIAQQADDKTESVSDKPHVNDNVIKLGSSKNTGTNGDKKVAANTSLSKSLHLIILFQVFKQTLLKKLILIKLQKTVLLKNT